MKADFIYKKYMEIDFICSKIFQQALTTLRTATLREVQSTKNLADQDLPFRCPYLVLRSRRKRKITLQNLVTPQLL